MSYNITALVSLYITIFFILKAVLSNLLPVRPSPLLWQTCTRTPTWLSCILASMLVIWPGACEQVHVEVGCKPVCKPVACESVGIAPFFSWWVAGPSRTSWPAIQGTTVPLDPRTGGGSGLAVAWP